MTEPTLTMKLRGRAVTLDEAMESTQRLINSHFHKENSARISIPVNVNDDDVIATDFLWQLKIGLEQREHDHSKI